jgi:hypothetical protein
LSYGDGNPFFVDEYRFVTIKDVKDGWVLYAMHPLGKHRMFQNETMEIKEFLNIYKKVEK